MKPRQTIFALAILLMAVPALAQETKKAEPAAKAPAAKTAPAKAKVVPAKVVPAAKAAPAKAAPAAKRTVEPKATPAPAAAPATQPTSQPADQPDIVPPTPPAGLPQVDPDDLGGLLKALIEAGKTGKWALVVGFIMMILTWIVNRVLKSKIPANVLPWLAIGLSTVTAVAFALATGVGWLNAIIVGVQTGLTAAGTWSAIGKYLPLIRKKEQPAPKPEAVAGASEDTQPGGEQ